MTENSGDYRFYTPAEIKDFGEGTDLQAKLDNFWSESLNGFAEQAVPPAPSFFYNPANTVIPEGSETVQVSWVAFSGRLMQYVSDTPPTEPDNPYKLPMENIYELADTGFYTEDDGSKKSLPDIPETFCPYAEWNGTLIKFGPYGPRGWQDEYCEWAVQRDENENIVRIDFCCENPEYWFALWSISPDKVVELYNDILNHDSPADFQITVCKDDLILKDADGKEVIDPGTGQPAYNPLNKWNSGPLAIRGSDDDKGGAVHLTSTPNTLQTEVGLGGASSQQFDISSSNSCCATSGTIATSTAQQLLCCGNYGQAYRHSDPHIGYSVNGVVGLSSSAVAGYEISFSNPFGLYMQKPTGMDAWSFSDRITVGTNVPADAKPSDIYQILRGQETLIDAVTGNPFPGNSGGSGNFILHAICQLPQSWLAMDPSITLADILINNKPIKWAGQIAEQFQMGLYARPIPARSHAPSVPCVSTDPTPAAPVQCMYSNIWDVYYPVNEENPTGQKMSLASNTVMFAPMIAQGTASAEITLIVNNYTSETTPGVFALAGISGGAVDTNIGITFKSAEPVTYAVPGNSYPSDYTALMLEVTVGDEAATGLRAIAVNLDGTTNSYPALINITAAQ